MKKFLKWMGWIAGTVIGLLLVAMLAVYLISQMRMNKVYQFQPAAIAIPTDQAAIAEGQRQFLTRGCSDCHGTDGAGKMVIDDPFIGHITAANLTAGQGGVGQTLADLDWVQAIRNGLGPDGKPLVVMPSTEYYAINDTDLGTLIAYLKSLPPVDRIPQKTTLGPLGRVLLVGNLAAVLPAERIDHDAPRPIAVAKGPTAEYGHYLAQSCMGCHGEGLSGGPVPGLPPTPPFPQNLTPNRETGLGSWQQVDFERVLRQGQRPDGTAVNAKEMPWPAFKHLTDEEITALWLYLQTVPAKPYGNR